MTTAARAWTYTVEPCDEIAPVVRCWEYVTPDEAEAHAQLIADRERINVAVVDRRGGEQRARRVIRPR